MSQTASVVLPVAIDPTQSAAARRLIDNADRIVLFAHQHPDPDSLGSCLGLAWALRSLGKHPVVASPDPVPEDFFSFLPGIEAVVTELEGPPFDLLIALDAGDLDRYGDLYARYEPLLRDAAILNIDHHVTSPGIGAAPIIDVEAAATAEILTLWLAQEGISISANAAKCLLAGIITDTRSFEFSATTPRTLLAGAYLMERGAQPRDIVKPMYRLKSFQSAKLFGLATATLQSDMGGRLTWAEITPAMWAAVNAPPGTLDDGIPSFLIDIKGAEIAVCLRQVSDTKVRVSIRTTEQYDATAITTRFGGGGHPRAAGCTIEDDLSTAKARVLGAARSLLGI